MIHPLLIVVTVMLILLLIPLSQLPPNEFELFLVINKMSNIEKIKFPSLDITGANYIQWAGNVKRHLKSMGALATIQKGNKCSEETKTKAGVFLHQHIDEMLEFEYSNCDDPSILWKDLETRFNNQMEVLLPSARDE
ncbi:hypothetical protein Tco_0850583 [Tanacetum coccineum]